MGKSKIDWEEPQGNTKVLTGKQGVFVIVTLNILYLSDKQMSLKNLGILDTS